MSFCWYFGFQWGLCAWQSKLWHGPKGPSGQRKGGKIWEGLQKEIVSRAKKVKAARAINGCENESQFLNWKFDDCRAYLQYKWSPKDPAMANNIGARRKHCLEIMMQKSPPISPHISDDKHNCVAGALNKRTSAEQAVLDSLMQMGGRTIDHKDCNWIVEVDAWEGDAWFWCFRFCFFVII